MLRRLLPAILAAVFAGCGPATVVRIQGDLQAGHPVTVTVTGPECSEEGNPNPFLDYRMEVEFTHQSGLALRIPGYFATDGRSADSGASAGDQWRAHFLPPLPGHWSFKVSLVEGDRVALEPANEGVSVTGDGTRGELEIAAATGSPGDSDSWNRGKLHYVGKRYLRFALSGDYFLKAGTDSPENFLAFADFDFETEGRRESGEPRPGEAAVAPRHRYEPHVKDWREGDPTWRDGRGKGIIGALNYLHEQGVNSVYFLTMNVAGDGDDVWPYLSRNDRYRFDCSRLDQWNVVFDHMDRLGLMMHVVLTETENESLFESEEGGTFADSRKIYYRELIARFAHHLALVWNLGEENGWDNQSPREGPDPGKGNTDKQRKAFARYLRDADPYDNPIVVHTLPGDYDRIYAPLLGFDSIDGPSLQMGDVHRTHAETLKWVQKSAATAHPWFVCLDEIGPAETGVLPDSEAAQHDEIRRFGLWGNLMAGGAGVEWYFGYRYPHNDLNLEDFRSREQIWKQTATAIRFFQATLPFQEMVPADDLVSNQDAYCLAKAGEVYLVYLGNGGTTNLEIEDGTFQVRWFDPVAGGELQEGSVRTIRGPGNHSIGSPPGRPVHDWAVLVRK